MKNFNIFQETRESKTSFKVDDKLYVIIITQPRHISAFKEYDYTLVFGQCLNPNNMNSRLIKNHIIKFHYLPSTVWRPLKFKIINYTYNALGKNSFFSPSEKMNEEQLKKINSKNKLELFDEFQFVRKHFGFTGWRLFYKNEETNVL